MATQDLKRLLTVALLGAVLTFNAQASAIACGDKCPPLTADTSSAKAPEPGSVTLFALGLIGLLMIRRKG